MPARRTLVLVLALAAALVGTARAAAPAPAPVFRILAFTKTTGYRHASIPAALAALRTLGDRNGFGVDEAEDGSAFTEANLARYKVVVFLLTTGDVLDDGQQAAFERYIRAGHGWVGVHSASDTEYDWAWYGGLVGAFFQSHPAIQQATLNVADPTHASTVGLPRQWTRSDEWYAFQTNPRPAVHVLLTIDETTYAPADATMGADHPIAWWHDYDGGRAWYTAMGHTDESYAEPLFLSHLLGGIQWASGVSVPAVPPTPSIVSLTTAPSGKRIAVTAKHPACACDATLRVTVRGKVMTKTARADAATTRMTTAALPAGRWQLSFVLKNRTTGATATVRRSVRVGV